MRKIKTNSDFEWWLDKKISHVAHKLFGWKTSHGKYYWITKRLQAELDTLIEIKRKITA